MKYTMIQKSHLENMNLTRILSSLTVKQSVEQKQENFLLIP
ncbi:hypothetical protein M153_17200015745 [Pseudoloma neurophilia]|uniref:Uncharacterized protein n=1 Tax=Pseudoloma neurophilia TaxID=146866 RepID=A0A0R0LZC2_9MICR|nr:hypothetical protein M153_17200015745 [Pseudoloma neurophilia]